MSETINNEVYLNGVEAAQYLDVSSVTWQKMRQSYGLQEYTLLGKNAKFYKQTDLDALPRIKPVKNAE